jgi:hypothetical protein
MGGGEGDLIDWPAAKLGATIAERFGQSIIRPTAYAQND